MGQEFRVAKDEFELSLELSIGGCYANSGNKDLEREKGRPHEDINREIPRSDFSGCENQNDKCEFPDAQRKREIQALKRREARMKREVKKSRGPNGVARAEERESREREGTPVPVPVPEESAAKREKTGAEKLNTSLFGENKVCGTHQQMQAQFLLPVGNGLACPWVVPFWGSNYVVAGEGDGQSSSENVAAAAPCSWVVSHHGSTCTSNKGGSSSDSGSQSSSIEKQDGSKLQHLELDRINNTTTTTPGNAAASTPHTTTAVVTTSPTPASQLHMHMHMPCVSTTGTKTITGFLYKYTKSEVSIMCVCHGSFFSPAQFVEHAGGVNVTNPLRHITVVPSLVK